MRLIIKLRAVTIFHVLTIYRKYFYEISLIYKGWIIPIIFFEVSIGRAILSMDIAISMLENINQREFDIVNAVLC